MRQMRLPSDTAGFTLIEVVVAMSLFGLLLGALYTTFSGTIEAWKRAEARAEVEQNLRAATRFLSRDLENLVSGPDAMLSGVSADETADLLGSLQLVAAPEQQRYGAAVEVLYQVDNAGLTRRVLPVPALQKTGDGELEPFADEVVAPMVKRLQLRFLVDGEWQDTAPTETSGLPQAVEVIIWAGAGEQAAGERSRTVTINPRVGATVMVGEPGTVSGGVGSS